MTASPSAEARSTLALSWLAELRQNGLRITPSRRAVVEIIAASRYVLSPLEVYEHARKKHKRLGLVSVYRTVDKLEELGLIQRVHQPSGCQAFIAASTGHQHMLVCQACGRVEFFEGDKLDPLIEDVGSGSGYRVHDHWLQLFGTCRECQETSNP